MNIGELKPRLYLGSYSNNNKINDVEILFDRNRAYYFESMKKLLYTLPKTAMKETFQRYSDKVPEPLNTLFTDRITTKTAVQKHED